MTQQGGTVVMIGFGVAYVASNLMWWVLWPLAWRRPRRPSRRPVRLTWADDQ